MQQTDRILPIKILGSSDATLNVLQERLLSLMEITLPEQRIIIAIAGVPGSGKSTVAARLLEYLYGNGICDVAVAPMVGYLSLFRETDQHS